MLIQLKYCCNYIIPKQLANFSSLDNKGKTRLGMSLMHMNIRSLNKYKFDVIILLTLNNFNPDLLVLSETELNESNCYTNNSLPGFNFEHIDSPRHDLNFNLQVVKISGWN